MHKSTKKKIVFDKNKQKNFYKLSMDNNPIHLKSNYAKFFFDNKKVVYGVLIILETLSFLQKKEIENIKIAKFEFFNPIYVGDTAEVNIYRQKDLRIIIKVKNIICSQITLSLKKVPLKYLYNNIYYGNNLKLKKNIIIKIKNLKKNLYKYSKIDKGIINDLFIISYFVGGVFPGHGSIISSIEFYKVKNYEKSKKKENFDFYLKYKNKNFNFYIINFIGENFYKILIHKLKVSKKIKKTDFEKLIKKNEFKNTKNLVIGGTRGLGLITTKILLAGNGQVYTTYRKDKKNLEKDLENFKYNKKNFIKLNILSNNNYKELNKTDAKNIFYFPTPKIFIKKNNQYDDQNFNNFNKYYIKEFYKLCEYYENKKKNVKIFYPSSTSVLNRPLSMTEYSMSKMSSEILIQDINRSFEYVDIFSCRLPRMDTDQTVNATGIKSINPLKKMLTEIKKFI